MIKSCHRRLPPTSEQEPEPTFELEPKSKLQINAVL
ncbi:hypothetical protein pipiens_000083, partial [Culex pipiens pipiens]